MNKRTPFTIFFSFFITFSFFTNTHAQIKPMGNFRESISKDFYVIGIATRTTNQNGQSSKDIEALWLKFWNGSVRERITWMEIWNNKELNSNRAYQSDFTIHGKKYYDGDNAEVETYISLK
jgi:predicted transcriptional regulator YdeE